MNTNNLNRMETRLDGDSLYARNILVMLRGKPDGSFDVEQSISLAELKKHLTAAGRLADYADYCEIEEMLRKEHAKFLKAVDADLNYHGDEEESAEFKRACAKHMLTCDLNDRLFFERECLMGTVDEER
jgi:hypothetical protein